MKRFTRLRALGWGVCLLALLTMNFQPFSIFADEVSCPPDSPDTVCEFDLSGELTSTKITTAPASITGAGIPTPADEMIYQINLLRLSKNLPPLKQQANLTLAAQQFANKMASNNFFSHNDPDSNCMKPWDRMTNAGYTSWRNAAENIAAGYSDAAGAMEGFINSPSHYNTLINPNLREVGVGYKLDDADTNNVRLISTCPSFSSTSGPYIFYWVQDFGSRYENSLPVLPVIINNESFTTSSRQVTLYVYGKENGQVQWATQMRTSTDGTNWTAWENWAQTKTITLGGGNGSKTIYVETKSATGKTQMNSDTVYLSELGGRIFVPLAMH